MTERDRERQREREGERERIGKALINFDLHALFFLFIENKGNIFVIMVLFTFFDRVIQNFTTLVLLKNLCEVFSNNSPFTPISLSLLLTYLLTHLLWFTLVYFGLLWCRGLKLQLMCPSLLHWIRVGMGGISADGASNDFQVLT